MSAGVVSSRDVGLQGHYAGAISRLIAFLLDVLIVAVLFSLVGHLVEYLTSAVAGDRVSVSEHRLLAVVSLVAWTFLYFAYSLAAGGRTLGMSVVGLRVVRRDGGDVGARHAIVRVLALPFSFLLLGLGLLLILVHPDRRALHDLVAGTAVVYSWDARAARLRFLARDAPQHL